MGLSSVVLSVSNYLDDNENVMIKLIVMIVRLTTGFSCARSAQLSALSTAAVNNVNRKC